MRTGMGENGAALRGHGVTCVAVAAVLVGGVLVSPEPVAAAEKEAPIAAQERVDQLHADLQEVAAGEKPATAEKPRTRVAETKKPKRRLTVFVDESGVPTLTNIPERFTNQPGYVELEIEYEPVAVPEQYRNVPTSSYTDSAIAALVTQFSRRYGLDEPLVYAVIKAESNFDPNAVSPKGARGLMQLMPSTAAEMGIHNLFDPAENIAGGTQYLAKMLDLFDGDTDLALAAYNAGPQAVKNAGGVPNYDETRAYIRRVRGFATQFAGGSLRAEYRPSARGKLAGYLPIAKGKFYTVHFLSGYTQPAERVEEQDGLYILHFKGRVDAIKRELVTKVEKG